MCFLLCVCVFRGLFFWGMWGGFGGGGRVTVTFVTFSIGFVTFSVGVGGEVWGLLYFLQVIY